MIDSRETRILDAGVSKEKPRGTAMIPFPFFAPVQTNLIGPRMIFI
jgi:hypothetical protein